MRTKKNLKCAMSPSDSVRLVRPDWIGLTDKAQTGTDMTYLDHTLLCLSVLTWTGPDFHVGEPFGDLPNLCNLYPFWPAGPTTQSNVYFVLGKRK